MGEHNEEGALGVVLNRPSDTTVGEAVPDLEDLTGDEDPVYVGGPVQPSAVLVLAEYLIPAEAPQLVTGDVGFLAIDDEESEPPAYSNGTPLARARVFAGYAGLGSRPARVRARARRLDHRRGRDRRRLRRGRLHAVEPRPRAPGRSPAPRRPHAARSEHQLSFVHVERVRFGDLDANRHLNNVVFLRYFETARITYMRHLVAAHDRPTAGTGLGVIFAECHINYRAPVGFDEQVDILCSVSDVQRSSFRIPFQMRVADRLVAEGYGVLVGFDYGQQQAARLPDEFRARLQDEADGD